MANFEIPLSNQDPCYVFDIELSKKRFFLRYKFNNRVQIWTVDLYDAESKVVAYTIPFYSEYSLLAFLSNSRQPDGDLVGLNLNNPGVDSDRFILGSDVKLIYNDLED